MISNARTRLDRLVKPGLPNLHRVTKHLYRGAQPIAEGMKQLKKVGVKTVINLRSLHSDRYELKGTELEYVHIHMKPWHAEDEDIVRFLQIVTDKKRQPVFVHCQLGADRTGVSCAVYRIVVEGWSKEKAIEEMTQGGYEFHKVWKNLVAYLKALNVEKIKETAGLGPEPAE
jgi:tyrosine-protein phosphatase SIW14